MLQYVQNDVVGVYYIVFHHLFSSLLDILILKCFHTFDLKQHRVIFGVHSSKVAPASGSCAFVDELKPTQLAKPTYEQK